MNNFGSRNNYTDCLEEFIGIGRCCPSPCHRCPNKGCGGNHDGCSSDHDFDCDFFEEIARRAQFSNFNRNDDEACRRICRAERGDCDKKCHDKCDCKDWHCDGHHRDCCDKW